MRYEAKKNTGKACREMQKAIDAAPTFTNAYSALGEWYFKMHRFDSAATVFEQAYKRCPKGNTAFAKPLAKSFVFCDSTAKALQILNNYTPSKDNGEWQKLKDQALFINQVMSNADTDTAFNMGPRINTKDPEMFPFISLDTQTFYFTRRVNNMDQDFFFAKPDSCGGWFTARSMKSPFNTPDQELGQTMSADGHYLFFTRCENRSENGWDQGGCDLFMAYRSDSTWSVPQSFGATINTNDYEGMACLSPDNRELYFVSNRPGGYGGMDIWVSDFEDGLWQPPKNLGPEINTPGNEITPFLHIDNQTLFFASDGHQGMGGTDFFMSKRINDTTWSKPINMGYPINTTADEMSICVSVDGKKVYFASDRDSLAGNYDIYEMKLPQRFQPVPVSYIKGFVYDSISKDKLNYANIFISDANTGNQLFQFQSNRGDATFTITLPVGGKYVCNTTRISYQEVSDTISFTDQYLQNALEYDIPMLPDDYVRPIKDTVVFTVHFPKNSASLTDSDKAMISQAMDPWLMEKGITILVNGYTDNSGTPIINEQLSYTRANLVAQQLTTLGIDPLNIKSQGWGEANPIAPNDIEDNMSRNRRVEVIIRR